MDDEQRMDQARRVERQATRGPGEQPGEEWSPRRGQDPRLRGGGIDPPASKSDGGGDGFVDIEAGGSWPEDFVEAGGRRRTRKKQMGEKKRMRASRNRKNY